MGKPSPAHAAKCGSKFSVNPTGHKKFCFGANVDDNCTHAAESMPIADGIDCKNCFVGAAADAYYNLNYSAFHLNSVEAGLKDIHIRGAAGAHANFSKEHTFKGSLPLLTDKLVFKVIDTLVGCPICIPVKITVAVPTTVGISATFHGSVDVELGAELDLHLSDEIVKWDHVDGWSHPLTKNEVSVKPIFHLDVLPAAVEAVLELQTGVQIEVDNIIWYRLNLKPSMPVTITSQGSILPPKGKVCLNGGAEFELSHEADLHWGLLKYSVNHHWGPVGGYTFSKPNIINVCKEFNKTVGGPQDAVELVV